MSEEPREPERPDRDGRDDRDRDDRDDRDRDRDEPNPRWIETVVSIAGALGANRVRVRWKLQRWVNERRADRRRAAQRSAHVRYEHAVCPACGAVNARDEGVCTRCGAALHSRPREVLGRLGVTPAAISPTALIMVAILACYARTATAAHEWVDLPAAVLIQHGGNLPSGIADGEWWRLLTATLLHAGIWHLAFNLFAITMVAPLVERDYGRLGVPLLFVVTGVVASYGSRTLGLGGVGIGASGAVMGLIGAAAVAGHRSGTTIGKQERNAMVRWAIYTIVFGFAIGADNRAHVVGVVAGAAIGFALPASVRARRAARVVTGVLGGAALCAIAGGVYLVMVPPEGAFGGDRGTLIDDYVLCASAAQRPDEEELPASAQAEIARACRHVDDQRRACAAPVRPSLFDADDFRARCALMRQLDAAALGEGAPDQGAGGGASGASGPSGK